MTDNHLAPTELGTEKVGSLLKRYAVPGIIAMTASSLYNMVDSIFIGHIPGEGSLALSGLAVTFPLMNLSTALGTLVGVGAATLISVLLGQKNYQAANKVLANDISLNCLTGIIFAAVCLVFLDPILTFFGASPNTLPFAREYITVILLGNVITHLYFGLNALIRSSGNPRLAMRLTLFTVISNTILDPIFIFVLGMGIQGAAIATVLCQTMALSYSLRYFTRKDNLLRLPKGIFDLDWRIAKDSLAIGMGPFLMNSASCIVTMFINQQLLKYGGDLAIGAYGIANRINFMFIMVVMGFNQGMQPIAGYNFGALKYSRVKKVFKLTALWATGVCMLWFVASEFFPGVMVKVFTNDPELIDLADKGLRLMNPVVILVGWQMVSTNFFQSLGMVGKSIFLSLSRQLLFLVPLIYVLPLFMGTKGVFFSFPASDLIACITTLVLIHNLFRKFSKLQDGDPPTILGSKIKQ
ncbi:MAG: MATE family efflux transporter [Bacteroidales bacterium]|nr:MATE family efflux transporter [Bacteroidales bacterium]